MRLILILMMSMTLVACATTKDVIITTASILSSFPELVSNKKSEQETTPTQPQQVTIAPEPEKEPELIITQQPEITQPKPTAKIDTLPQQDNPFLTPTKPRFPITDTVKQPSVENSKTSSTHKNNQVQYSQPQKTNNKKEKKKQHHATPTQPQKCGSFPRTCSAMVSCQQARQALKCGMYKLDRDGDGLPCESLCGG